jgi:hypothetical protein
MLTIITKLVTLFWFYILFLVSCYFDPQTVLVVSIGMDNVKGGATMGAGGWAMPPLHSMGQNIVYILHAR